tara:strand:- start:1690 stop:2325 length:636 start_codon:yes stop_codon:yes gene_type:complete
MKITKQRLQQIIQEEINSYKASQLNEGIDVETMENIDSAVQAAYKEMMIPVKQDQVYADTDEPVSKDPKDMHEEAVKVIMSMVSDAIEDAMKSEVELNEDGHTDIPSAVRAMKTIIEDAGQMLQALEQMDGHLPTWWTNKMAVSASMLNKMRDYLLVPSQEMEEKLKPSMGAGAYVDDFRKSKAPQFKGKSDKKKQKMAIAAYLDDKDNKK